MSRVYLAPYSLRIRNKNSKEYQKFEEVFKKKEVLEIIFDFLMSLQKSFTDDIKEESILKIESCNKNLKHNYINGIVNTGSYGNESKLYDRKSGNHVFDRKADHAEVMPFYFLIGVDGKMDTALIVLQRFGQYGISKTFFRQLREYLKEFIDDKMVVIQPVMSDTVLQKLVKEGEIKKVSFKKFTIPADLASAFSKKGKDSTGYLVMSLVAKRNNKLNLNERLNSLMFGDGRVKRLVELQNFEYDETKVTIQDGENKRTVTLGNNSFKAYYDITDEIERETNKHPTFKSVDSASKSLLTELFKLIVK